MKKVKKIMNHMSDPILIVLQLKSFQTNQLNLLKKNLKSIDLKSKIHLAKNLSKPFETFCQSSTFILSLSELRFLNKVFPKTISTQEKFLEMHSSGIECLILGGFFQGQTLDCVQLQKLLEFERSKLHILKGLGKYPKFPLLLKKQLSRLQLILKANNGN